MAKRVLAVGRSYHTGSQRLRDLRINPEHPVRINCIECHKMFIVWVVPEQFVAWVRGELIQTAMPNLSVGDRELLISNICESCWDEHYNFGSR